MLSGILFAAAALVIIFSLNDRFKVRVFSESAASIKVQQIYGDLDNDNLSEKIEFHEYSENVCAVLVYRKGKISGQWTFPGRRATMASHLTGDINNDNIKEVFLFTREGDSLFLNCVDPLNNLVRFSRIPVCRLYPISDQCSSMISPVIFTDINKDDVNEFLFTINTGYETRPRGIFAFYPGRKMVTSSPESCSILDISAVYDTDSDGAPEIFCNSRATGNCAESRAFTDLYGWLMVFSPDLSFRFPPVRLGPYPAEFPVVPFKCNEDYCTLVLHDYRGTDTIGDFLALYDHKGSLLKRKELDMEAGEPVLNPVLLSADSLYSGALLVDHSGSVYKINEDLTLSLYRKIPPTSYLYKPKLLDIEGDGKYEIIMADEGGNHLLIFRHDFTNPVRINLYAKEPWLFISEVRDFTGISKFSIDNSVSFVTYAYSRGFVYRFWYLVVIIVTIVSGTLTTLVAKLSELRRMRIEKSKFQLAELQLKSVKNQIDPHFTFNLLETFGNLIDEHDSVRAEFIFNKYSGLLKASVLNSDKLLVTLREELDFVSSYIELEKFRYGGRFGYGIIIGEDVDTSLMLPKMMVHIFAENAIKHGLRHLNGREGMLKISVTRTDGTTCIVIEDNGIGREKARKLDTFSTGRGNSIVTEMAGLCRTLYRSEINFSVRDLNAGTEVTIMIRNT